MPDRDVSLRIDIDDAATASLAAIGAAVKQLIGHLDNLGSAISQVEKRLSSLHAPRDLGAGLGGEGPVTKQGGVGLTGIMSLARGVTGHIGRIATLVGGPLSSAFGAVSRMIGSALNAVLSFTSALGKMAATAAGVGAAAFGYLGLKAVTAAANIETMYQKLLTALKTPAAAQGMLDWARRFADVTPFQTDEVIEATTRLENYGLSARQWLPMVGNMAASMGKSVVDGVEAIADAISGGGLERLKEFGISSMMLLQAGAQSSAGGVSYGSERAIEALKGALASIMSSRFGGAMERMATTLAGKWSTFVGALQNLATVVGNALMPLLKPLLDGLTRFADTLRGALAPYLEALAPLMQAFGEGFKSVTDAFTGADEAQQGLTKSRLAVWVDGLKGKFQAFGAQMAQVLPWLLDRLPVWIEKFFAWVPTIMDKLMWFANQAQIIFTWLGDMAMRFSGPMVTGILNAFIGAANGVVWFIGQLQTSGSSINNFMTGLVNGIWGIVQTIGAAIQTVMAQLADPNSLLSSQLNSLTKGIQDFANALNQLLTQVLTPQNVGIAMALLQKMLKLGTAVMNVVGPAVDTFQSLPGVMPGELRDLKKKVEGGGGSPAERQAWNSIDRQMTGGRHQVDLHIKPSAEFGAAVTRDQRKAWQRAGLIPDY